MKKYFIVLGVLSILGFGCFAGAKHYQANKIQEKCLAGQGCCSWHGGQCGCTPYGEVRCCDGTTSPSCRCY